MELLERIDRAERQLRRLDGELRAIRAAVAAESAVEKPAAPPTEAEPVWFPAGPAESPPLERPARPEFRLPELPRIDGARAMAIAGGIVTLLGIVLFFALAVNRGWLGASGRVLLGGGASVLVFAGGVWLRRRFGETYSALAAAGVGIAGAYGTLAFAAVRYDLILDEAALGLAAVVAAFGAALSLRWSSQQTAGFALVGAILMPLLLAVDSGLTTTGLAFVEIVLAATCAVALLRRWHVLLVGATLAALPQVAVAVAYGDTSVRLVVAAAAFFAIVLATGIVVQLRSSEQADPLAVFYVLGGGAFAALSAPALFEGSSPRGFALLAVAAVYGSLCAAFFRRRDLASLLGAIGLTIAAIAGATLLSDQTLAITWAGEAVVLAWLARRVGERRFLAGSFAYLGLALAHAVLLDAPPRDLFTEVPDPAAGAPTVLAVAAATALVGLFARRLLDAVRGPFVLLAAVLGAYAASLGILALPVSFGWGHVAVDGAWALVALGLVAGGLSLGAIQLRDGGLAVCVVVVAKALIFDVSRLDGDPRLYALLVAGAAVLAAGYLVCLRAEAVVGGITAPIGAALVSTAALTLVHGKWDGAALLAIAGVNAALAAPLFRRERNVATVYWAIAAVLALPAAALLLDGAPLVVAWAGAGAVLALLAHRLGEERLQLASLAYVAAGLAHTVFFDASPDHFFSASVHPAEGVPVLLAVAAAGAVLVSIATRGQAYGRWIVGAIATYAASLGILELFELGAGDLQTHFQRGHTAVSAFWGILGLGLLYVGLNRRAAFRLAGFALFGASLAKIFLYDLAYLSSVARALSFLAVGAVLLLGGFFYQRSSAQTDS